jgi:hypothetical protein
MQWYGSGTFSWYFSGMGQREAEADLFNPLAAPHSESCWYGAVEHDCQAYGLYEMVGSRMAAPHAK